MFFKAVSRICIAVLLSVSNQFSPTHQIFVRLQTTMFLFVFFSSFFFAERDEDS